MARTNFVLLLVLILSTAVLARNNGLSVISECICQGYNATYECNVVGPGSTVWKGDGFRDCSNNRITLFHSQFSGGTVGTCNSGAIVGRSIRVENNCYTSQLNIFVSPNVIGRDVFCAYDNGLNEVDVGNSTVTLTTVPLPPPTNVLLINATSRQLIFSWNAVVSNCPATKYNIIATSCGTCPSSTRSTTVTCLNPQPQPNAGVTCTFSVRTETCEGVISEQSELIVAKLKVPDVPVVKIVPIYSQREGVLTSLHVTITESPPFSISAGINGSTTCYNIIYTNSTAGETCDSAIIPARLCTNGVCIHVFNLSSSLCSPLIAPSVTVFATNILGDGEVSDEFTFDETNNFVTINYDMMTRRFTCSFINKQDVSEKSCSITLYRDCQQQQILTAQANSTDSQITLVLEGFQTDTSIYCYTVAASNDTITLNVTGTIDQMTVNPTANTGAIIGGVLASVAFIAAILIALLFLGLGVRHGKIPYCIRAKNDNIIDGAGEDLILVRDDRFKTLEVEKDCELKPFIQDRNLTFQRGAAFYEFTRAEEDIAFSKEVILMDKKTKQLYTGKTAIDMIGAPGEGINKPKLKKYRVFVQSKGIGVRPLQSNSLVLYECNPGPSDADKSYELIKVDSNRFQTLKVTMDSELREYIESNKLTYKSGCTFFEFKSDKEDISERKEVILMDKNTGEIFTGPGVLVMINAPGRDIERPSLDRWTVFIQSIYGTRIIHEGTLLLYENLGSDTDDLEAVDSGRLEILNVNKTCSLRDFVEKTHQLVPYKPRRFFFEFVSSKEEITDDKEIILLHKDTGNMFTGSMVKEMIGAQAKVVRKPSLNKYRVFVQNGGGGSRCLKAGTSLLYERNYKF